MRAARLSPIVAMFIACAHPAPRPTPVPAPAATRPAPRLLALDTTVTTASGATFLAPRGWWLTEGDPIVLEDPDRALRATLVEAAEPDAMKAVAAAWQRAAPGFARAPQQDPDTPPPAGGWDAVTRIAYQTTTAEHREVSALARRYGATTYVALIDADAAAIARRGAQLDTALGTLHPNGMHEESFAGETPRPIDDARAAELDAFIAHALARLEVPGAAVAIVQGGKVVYERSFGVRELGAQTPAPITPQTLFLVASITKPMTTMMEATLVDAGVFAWDTPVTRLLPSFALGDADVTRKVALWHMSCACTGMPRQDLEDLFEYGDVTPEARIASMKSMKPTTGFGETFQYSNLMVAAGGFAAAHAFAPGRSLGDAYAAAMRAKIFTPIGMTSTTLDFAAVARADHAMPHALAIDGTPRSMPLAIERDVVPIAPAGGVWTNVRDMERYVMTELAGGVAPGGTRVVSEANLGERRKPRVRVDEHDQYGLGLDVGTFHGLPTIGHDGGAFGYGTTMFMLPEQGVGIIVFTNVRNGGGYQQLPFNEAVQRKIVEELFAGAKDLAASSVEYDATAKRREVAAGMARLDRTPDPAWVARLAGTYANASLGTVVLDARATFDAGEWQTAFGRRVVDDGTTKLVFLDPPFAGGEIVVGGDDAHPTLTVVYGQAQYVFTRAAH